MIIIKTDCSFILLKEHGFLIIHILVNEMCNISLQGWKWNAIYEF